MKKVGIWLDSKNAHVISLTEDQETIHTINSNIEFFNRTGTGGTRSKWGGNQDVTHEKNYLEKENAQFKNYFKHIAETILDSDELLLFGPADINEKLKKVLAQHYKSLFGKLKAVKKADSMTLNQIKAYVKDFFRQE
ncbi:hypothetical protein [Maribacter hydrothermalis]|uniref:Protein required for attachment to host cells n=1 Tax=Maribacter hydrothermalis TaxID=1836467 RepID=A0A1B7YZF6_9FLAO|nr:hypothetical protein [Maribacter hydrothermalis]APQ16153.1 hypothetical protein BTR34_01775 [Maribacter hydrothermalis]OBR35670.1 hypothetical protein A9200_10740 [Maribacter hydrothermalis]